MVKVDYLKPSRGGQGAALRARYWSRCPTLLGALLCSSKALVGASPYGTGSDVLDTYSTNRACYSNLGITYVP